MKKLILVIAIATSACYIKAEIISKDAINADNLYKFGGSMTEYLDPQVEYSKAPKGFKPFYMSHYGRHGSRYLLSTSQYADPYNTLKEAYDKGVLTEFGKSVMDRLEIMMNDADGRLGDLTKKGQRQHREIARRMVENYPEIFNKKAHITARSTTSHRVVASMTAALMEFSTLLPTMQIDFDDSDYDRHYMNSEDPAITSYKNSKERSVAVSNFNEAHFNSERLMCELFTDTTFITRYEVKATASRFSFMGGGMQQPTTGASSIQDRSDALYNQIYEVAANMQSHDLGFNLDDVFTYDEWYEMFTTNNTYWYSVSANSPLTSGMVPYGRASLLMDIIDKANLAISTGETNAHLRYGHDTALFPLLCLMEINDCGWSVSDYEKIADKWVAYDIVHMGSNLQLIFFKDKNGTILVRALLNEEEATLPVEPYTDSKGKEHKYFYEWEKVEAFYMNRIAEFKQKLETAE